MWLGFTLRCPNCRQGKMFDGLFKMVTTCPNCGVVYERLSGEYIGGMFINLGVAETLSVVGFFIAEFAFKPPLVPHLIFWAAFNVLFVVLFYRHARGLWVAINYLTSGVYADHKPPPGKHDS
jgi:uncharacterized protein (DUF983 family)